jgi:acetate kinase
MAKSSIILCVNSGSSSLKFALYRMGSTETEALVAEGAVERIGLAGGRLWIRSADRKPLAEGYEDFPDHPAAIRGLQAAAEGLKLPTFDAIGHRVVHGGPNHTRPERVTPELIETLRRLVAFAPLHLPSEILCIEAALRHFPDRPQAACFDTAFHRRMPDLAQRFPLPRALWEEGVRRYGFHGLSYEYIVETLGDAAAGRVIVAHLGNGASMAAIKDGQPIDTTMGFTPTGGFMMGTRTGDLDPGVLLYLINQKRYDARQLARLVDHEAGLLGVSGISPDMKTLLDKRASDPHAVEAVELFCYQLRKTIGALAAALGGLDTLVFTGGIGERAATVRWEVCRGLECLGVRLDAQRNEASVDTISTPQSACSVRVIPTQEDLMIARHTSRLLWS